MKQIKHFFKHAFLFAGKLHPTHYSNASVRGSYWSRAEHEINESGVKIYEHCWCDGCGYGPCEFSNSNCTGSVRIYGVWKANKFWSGCKKYLSMEFRILTEYFFFSSLILCNAWYFVYICKRIYVTLSLIQHPMHSHSMSHISFADATKVQWEI